MLETYNTKLAAVVEVLNGENAIIIKQGDEKVLDANNAFGLILNPEFQKYKDCYVKDIKAVHQRLVIITIETPEEREDTERLEEWEKCLSAKK